MNVCKRDVGIKEQPQQKKHTQVGTVERMSVAPTPAPTPAPAPVPTPESVILDECENALNLVMWLAATVAVVAVTADGMQCASRCVCCRRHGAAVERPLGAGSGCVCCGRQTSGLPITTSLASTWLVLLSAMAGIVAGENTSNTDYGVGCTFVLAVAAGCMLLAALMAWAARSTPFFVAMLLSVAVLVAVNVGAFAGLSRFLAVGSGVLAAAVVGVVLKLPALACALSAALMSVVWGASVSSLVACGSDDDCIRDAWEQTSVRVPLFVGCSALWAAVSAVASVDWSLDSHRALPARVMMA